MATFAWDKICSELRLGADGKTHAPETDDNGISVAEKDAERILTSSPFRRLQGKTQVYPLPQTDFVRNRLTHTIEVAHIGRTLMTMIGRKAGMPDQFKSSAAQVVYNGCLLHDIGNPPFGHSGESSIREFFATADGKIDLVKWAKVDDGHRRDLLFFDGNAQGFRIATRLAGWKQFGGLRLSAATLTSMVKYAFPSTVPLAQEKEKFGFMSSEAAFAQSLFENAGLVDGEVMYRNPLSLVVEAADDIAYLTSDVQDAHRYGDLPYDTVRRLLTNLSSPAERPSDDQFKGRESEEDFEENHINYLRAAAISYMTKAAAAILSQRVFNERKQTPGQEKFALWTSHIPMYAHLEVDEREIRKVSTRLIYRGTRKIATQVAGGRIIKFVLETQLLALNEIYSKVFDYLVKYPEGDDRAKEDLGTGHTFNDVVKHAVDTVDRHVSREAAQVFWGMPKMARDLMGAILSGAFADGLDKEHHLTAFKVIQISLDFVAGTTDRYLSDYSKSLSGPTLT